MMKGLVSGSVCSTNALSNGYRVALDLALRHRGDDAVFLAAVAMTVTMFIVIPKASSSQDTGSQGLSGGAGCLAAGDEAPQRSSPPWSRAIPASRRWLVLRQRRRQRSIPGDFSFRSSRAKSANRLRSG